MQKPTRISILLILFMGLASCSDSSDIKKAVYSRLKDPDSAKFGEISTVKMQEKDIAGNNIEIACVTYNAKNSLGGYVGERQALVVKTIHGWEMDENPSEVSHKDCVNRLIHRAEMIPGELDQFIVSLADKGTDHYIQLSIIVKFDNEFDLQLFNQLEPRIRNNITLILSGKTSEDLSKTDSKQNLSNEIREEISSILNSQTKEKIKIDDVVIKSMNIT